MATEAKIPSVRKKKVNTNKYKVNQYTDADPRQALFLASYLDPKSITFSNALQSALQAGYSQEYAENLTHKMPAWLSEAVGNHAMLAKAERNLNEILDLPSVVPAMGMFGPITKKIPTGKFEKKLNKKTKKFDKVEIMEEEPVLVLNPKLISIKSDASKFIAERIGRRTYGVKETPGSQTFISLNFFNEDQLRKIASRTIDGDTTSAE